MSDDQLTTASFAVDIKDVELVLLIRKSPAEHIVIEIRDGDVTVSNRRSVVKDVPFQTKKKRR